MFSNLKLFTGSTNTGMILNYCFQLDHDAKSCQLCFEILILIKYCKNEKINLENFEKNIVKWKMFRYIKFCKCRICFQIIFSIGLGSRVGNTTGQEHYQYVNYEGSSEEGEQGTEQDEEEKDDKMEVMMAGRDDGMGDIR